MKKVAVVTGVVLVAAILALGIRQRRKGGVNGYIT